MVGGWPEEGAWACHPAAECCVKLERWRDAIEPCAKGLAIRPATAWLAWLAGFAAFKSKCFEDAIAWSNMAMANGLSTCCAGRTRRSAMTRLRRRQ